MLAVLLIHAGARLWAAGDARTTFRLR